MHSFTTSCGYHMTWRRLANNNNKNNFMWIEAYVKLLAIKTILSVPYRKKCG
jgi:hypothetical protein